MYIQDEYPKILQSISILKCMYCIMNDMVFGTDGQLSIVSFLLRIPLFYESVFFLKSLFCYVNQIEYKYIIYSIIVLPFFEKFFVFDEVVC